MEPPGSGLGSGCCWARLEARGAPLGLGRDAGGWQPRVSSDRRLMLGPGSPLLAPIKGFGGAGVSGSAGAAPRAQECRGSVGAHGGDPGGCGTGCGGSHPKGPTLLGVSALGYLCVIPSAAPSGKAHVILFVWLCADFFFPFGSKSQ